MTKPRMFEPRLALASLSGQSDARWACNGIPHAGAAFLGGISLCERTRDAARAMVQRGRAEFLPQNPLAFIDTQLQQLDGMPIRAGVNVRSTGVGPLTEVAQVCADMNAILEINAHCRQHEMCHAGAGESLLRDTNRLCKLIAAAADTGVTVSVKVRAEVDGVDLIETACRAETAGAQVLHVDAMDTEESIAWVSDATDCFVIANNGVRDEETAKEYFEYGADAISVGRPSTESNELAHIGNVVSDIDLPPSKQQ